MMSWGQTKSNFEDSDPSNPVRPDCFIYCAWSPALWPSGWAGRKCLFFGLNIKFLISLPFKPVKLLTQKQL
jgi:hypothetical protein